MILIWSIKINQPVQSKKIQGHILSYKTEVTPAKTKEKNEQNQNVMATIKFNYFKWEKTTFFISHL